MTAAEAYDLTTHGGATAFAKLIAACDPFRYCLCGDFAVNWYVEQVYTLDADLVVIASSLPELSEQLRDSGFKVEHHPYSLNAQPPTSDLRIQFSTDERYQPFLPRAIDAEVLGVRLKIACLEDVTRGKLWAYTDPNRRLSKRKKDELDLIRLAESYPDLKSLYPAELRDQIDRG